MRLPRLGIPYEAQVFGRMAAFGLVLGAAYWFLTYETAGSVLLFTFGIASAIATIGISVGALRARRHAGAPGAPPEPGRTPLEAEPVPHPGWTPLLLSVGLGLVALGGVLGPWLLIPGILVVLVAATSWLGTAVRETDVARGLHRPDTED